METPEIEGSLEENVLTLLCYSDNHAAELVMQFSHDIFSTKAYRDIAKAAMRFLTDYGKAPQAHIVDLFEDRLHKGAEGKLLRQTFESMEKLQAVMRPAFIMDQLESYIRERKMRRAIEKASDLLDTGNLDGAWEEMRGQDGPKQDDADTSIWLADPKQALSFLDQAEEDYIPIGIDAMDERGIRPARGTVLMFLAPRKRGKSWFLINVGKACLQHRRKVLHITLEMSAKQVAKRYIQALFGMATREQATRTAEIKRDAAGHVIGIDFNERMPEVISQDTRAAIAKKLHPLQSRPPLLIKKFPSGSLTIPRLKAYIEFLIQKYHFKPDVLIVDYIDLFDINSDQLRVETGRTVVKFRGICDELQMAGVTASQTGRASEKAKLVTTDMVAEDWSKVATSDTVITYSRTKEEKKHGLARILAAAVRDVEDELLFLVTQNYATGQFAIDSTLFEGDIIEEHERLTSKKKKDADDDRD